jgi:hypothetical protein
MANNTFLVSVANAIGRDANTGNGIFLGKANISSAFNISTSAQEVRGGVGNPLLYVFYHSRKVEIKVESATFDKSFISMNTGGTWANASVTTVQSECVTLVAGVGTCSLTPSSDIVVFMRDGTIQNCTPAGKVFTTSPSGGSDSVDIVYNTLTTCDQVSLSTSTPPQVIDLTLIGEVRDNTNVILYYLQVNIPRFQISGNYALSFNANGVSTQSIDGMALETTATDCSGGNYFAKVSYVRLWLLQELSLFRLHCIIPRPPLRLVQSRRWLLKVLQT